MLYLDPTEHDLNVVSAWAPRSSMVTSHGDGTTRHGVRRRARPSGIFLPKTHHPSLTERKTSNPSGEVFYKIPGQFSPESSGSKSEERQSLSQPRGPYSLQRWGGEASGQRAPGAGGRVRAGLVTRESPWRLTHRRGFRVCNAVPWSRPGRPRGGRPRRLRGGGRQTALTAGFTTPGKPQTIQNKRAHSKMT